jgi:hypothetical protein
VARSMYRNLVQLISLMIAASMITTHADAKSKSRRVAYDYVVRSEITIRFEDLGPTYGMTPSEKKRYYEWLHRYPCPDTAGSLEMWQTTMSHSLPKLEADLDRYCPNWKQLQVKLDAIRAELKADEDKRLAQSPVSVGP